MIASDDLRLLVADGYTRNSRDVLAAGGMKIASDIYRRMLSTLVPGAKIDVATPADADASLPDDEELARYDGVAITGSDLSVLHADNPSVAAQIDFQRRVFALGVPSFGSCWALQVGTVAAGGRVAVNPNGREMGFARKISLTADGRAHLMYQDKGAVFDCFASHEDEVIQPPANSKILAGNAMSSIQAMEIRCGKGTMWCVQYHPEFELKDMADLIRCRTRRLIGLGFFTDAAAAKNYVDRLNHLHQNPDSKPAAWSLGIDSDILDTDYRFIEARNWIEHLVLPQKRDRQSQAGTQSPGSD